jgi:8-oxo-dGTP diphosphatase
LAANPTRAVSAAILHEGRFLLVRRGRAPARGLYAFPGGRVERGETLEDAVLREIAEETGARISNVRHVVDLQLSSETRSGVVEFILSVHAADFDGGVIVAGDDAETAAWYTLDELETLPLASSVLDIARQIVRGTMGHRPCG